MKVVKINNLIFCLVAVFLCSRAVAQEGKGPDPMSPFEAIEVLKNGTLVVRLSTNANKIEALEKKLATTANEKERLRYQQMLDKTRLETRTHNLWLMEAFDSNYTYSKVIFMPDTAATNLKKGIKKGIFYGADLKIDPESSVGDDFLVAYYGKSFSGDDAGNDGINVLDGNLQPLRAPFPFFVGRTSIRRMFEELLNKDTALEHYLKLVKKFQKRLVEFGG